MQGGFVFEVTFSLFLEERVWAYKAVGCFVVTFSFC